MATPRFFNTTITNTIRTVSFGYTQAKTKMGISAPYNYIRDGLWLGSLPTVEGLIEEARDFDKKLCDSISQTTPEMPLRLVVSVVEEKELEGQGFAFVKTVSPERWKKEREADHCLLPMVDFTADVNINDAVEVVRKILHVMETNASVYIHCKAGRSRSAMIAAIILTLTTINESTQQLFTLNEAIEYLKYKRAEVKIGSNKRKTAKKIITHYDQCELLSQIEKGLSFAKVLSSFGPERQRWLLDGVTDEDFDIYFKTPEAFQELFTILPTAYKVYFIDKFQLQLNLLYQVPADFDDLNEKYHAYKLQHYQETMRQLITIIQDPIWASIGSDYSGSKVPSGIEKMRVICAHLKPENLSVDEVKGVMVSLNKSHKNSYWLSLNVTRNKRTEHFYQLIGQIHDSFITGLKPHIYLDQLYCFYQAALNNRQLDQQVEITLSHSM